MRKALAVLAVLLCSATSSLAQVSLGFSSPGVSIGIDLPAYPELVQIPDYPVSYAPRLNANYFFYDGQYWVFDGVNCALLPRAARLLSWLGAERAAPLGRALGQHVGAASSRLGSLEPRIGAGPGPVADLSAALRGEPLPARG